MSINNNNNKDKRNLKNQGEKKKIRQQTRKEMKSKEKQDIFEKEHHQPTNKLDQILFMENRRLQREQHYHIILGQFLEEKKKNLQTPALVFEGLDSFERKTIHTVADDLDLEHVSKGATSNRAITVDLRGAQSGDLLIFMRKKFARQFRLPITIFDRDHFTYYLNTFEPILGTATKWKMLLDDIRSFSQERNMCNQNNNNNNTNTTNNENTHNNNELTNQNESQNNNELEKTSGTLSSEWKISDLELAKHAQKYFKFCDEIIFTVVKDMFGHPDFAKFEEAGPAEWFPLTDIPMLPKLKLYESANHNKFYLSLDIKTANFNCLRMLNPSLVKGATSYQEFFAHYSKSPYLAICRSIRQTIFGYFYQSKQDHIQDFITGTVAKQLVSDKVCALSELHRVSHDEIIIESPPNHSQLIAKIEDVLKRLNFEKIVRIEMFRLLEVSKARHFYCKEILNPNNFNQKTYKLKGVDPRYFALVYKTVCQEEIKDLDLEFTEYGTTEIKRHKPTDLFNKK